MDPASAQINASTVITAILSIAFTLWAGVVAWIGHGIRNDFSDIKEGLQGLANELKVETQRLNEYIVQTEQRLAVLEDWRRNHGPKQ